MLEQLKMARKGLDREVVAETSCDVLFWRSDGKLGVPGESVWKCPRLEVG